VDEPGTVRMTKRLESSGVIQLTDVIRLAERAAPTTESKTADLL
jgi:hypothetical protein